MIEAAVTRSVAVHAASGMVTDASWGIAVEAPVQVVLNGTPWTVLLATPEDLEDLAIGVAITERVLTDASAVQRVHAESYLQDVTVHLEVPESALQREALRGRAIAANSACGLCGLESLADLQARRASVPRLVEPFSDTAVRAAFDAMPRLQPLNQETRSVHAAAWCSPSGQIQLLREDVGRHNALDKLVGALARSDRLHEAGFVVMSSRCSYELVYKTAVTQASLLATVSAPTSMALSWSAALGVPVACRAGEAVVRFPEERIDAGG